jgi:hypothetical protein
MRMTHWRLRIPGMILLAASLFAQQNKRPEDSKSAPKSLEAQSASTIKVGSKDGMETVEIQNVAYEVTSTYIPGRPKDERLVLRKTIRSKYVVDDIGTDATVTLEAWPLGVDLKHKPLYSITYTGLDGQTVDQALFVGSRGTEEVDWWSVYKLGNGQHLFDTYVPLLKFSISRAIQTERYVGLEVPPDDASDARLKEQHVVGVLTYASQDRVMREALLTCDDRKQAQLLRSYADVTREVSLVEGPFQKGVEPSRTIKISLSQNYPSAPATISAMIPVVKDDLDLARAQLPARIHIAAWKR